MRVLFRLAATLLIAVPLFVVLVIIALAPKRRASLSLEGGTYRSLERGATGGSSRRATGAVVEVSR